MEGVKGVDGVDVEIYQVPETLPESALQAMHAPPKADHPVLTHDLIEKVCVYYACASPRIRGFLPTRGRQR